MRDGQTLTRLTQPPPTKTWTEREFEHERRCVNAQSFLTGGEGDPVRHCSATCSHPPSPQARYWIHTIAGSLGSRPERPKIWCRLPAGNAFNKRRSFSRTTSSASRRVRDRAHKFSGAGSSAAPGGCVAMTALLTSCSSTKRIRPSTGAIRTLPAGVHGMCSRDGKMSPVGPNRRFWSLLGLSVI